MDRREFVRRSMAVTSSFKAKAQILTCGEFSLCAAVLWWNGCVKIDIHLTFCAFALNERYIGQLPRFVLA